MRRRPETPARNQSADYVEAACRKVRIAKYHLETLRKRVADSEHRGEPLVPAPIPVQAHFEGVLFSFIAACDEVAETLNRVRLR